MDTTLSQPQSIKSQRSRRTLGIVLIGAALVISALFIAYQAANRSAAGVAPVNVISTQVLEQRYGLRVNLIAVTAASGLVDVRLKVLDAAKAKALLSESKNFPALKIANSDVTLFASEDSRAQVANLKDNGLIMILYPNVGNSVHTGSAVNVMFGETVVETIAAK